MDFDLILDILFYVILAVLILAILCLLIMLFIYFRERNKSRRKAKRTYSNTNVARTTRARSLFDGDNNRLNIMTHKIEDIPASNLFSAGERRMEYRRRGKSPSSVIDGVYNDMYRENGRPYNDMDRDLDADA